MATDSKLDFARYYDPLFGRVLGGLRGMVVSVVAPKSGMRVLDIGCGTGAQLAIFQEAACEVYGIDLSQPMLRIAKTKLSDLSNGDATKMPFPDQAFDLVLFSLFLHQLDASGRSVALEEAMRAVRTDGRILIVDFHSGPVKSIKGMLTKFVISTVEFLAGLEHYRNSRDFLSRGGIPFLASSHHVNVRKEIIVWDGNLGIYLMDLAERGTPAQS